VSKTNARDFRGGGGRQVIHRPSGDAVRLLAEGCSETTLASLDAAQRALLDRIIRCCLYCIGVGASYGDDDTAPLIQEVGPRTRRDPEGWPDCILMAFLDATVGAASDLDPLEHGPSHTALPAVVAACVAARLTGATRDEDIATAVVAGIETASRLRMTISGVRPGIGFHSSGTFGTIAAAATVSRLLGADTAQVSKALAIALTRMSGLSINSGSARICLTHFGWAAAHGLEAAWLASRGWTASMDLGTALESYFPGHVFDSAALDPGNATFTLEPPSTIFKLYPCNLFLNPLFQALAEGAPTDGPLHVRIPQIPHLDQAAPRTAREARYSAQAVATLATNYPATYGSFTDATLLLDNNAEFARLMRRVTVSLDPDIPTQFNQTYVEVRTVDGEHGSRDAAYYLRDLKPWNRAHAAALLEGMPSTDWVPQVFESPYLAAYIVARENAPRITASTGSSGEPV
jgi:hypothetical protein